MYTQIICIYIVFIFYWMYYLICLWNIHKCISLLWFYILFIVLAFSNFSIHMYLNTINYALLYDFRIFVYAKKSNSNANYCLLCLPHICTTWAQRRQFSIFTAWRTLLSSASQKLFLLWFVGLAFACVAAFAFLCLLCRCLRPLLGLPLAAPESLAHWRSPKSNTHTQRERETHTATPVCVCVCLFVTSCTCS